MSQPSLRVEVVGRRATLTLDRPPLNILDLELLSRLDEAVAELGTRPDLHLVVLQGAGPKAFSAGVSVQDHTADKVAGMLATFHRLLLALRRLPALCLAAVDGHCLGGGMELALACDLVLASRRSRFGQPEIELGCFPPFAAALYPQRIGRSRTLDLLVTGRTLTARQAERLGLATWVSPDDAYQHDLADLIERLTNTRSGAVMRLTKQAVAAGESLPLPEALAEAERLYTEELLAVEDMQEGLAAFLEKRRPSWRHR
ncbi:MAG TPA: enoyl-CoA hydratase/isomerase family protein [Thermoanaerobaculia bacterium]|nr:enoyl-CoA hydratase/isomerase family protein [Thermoanaerobaculia bacterium]